MLLVEEFIVETEGVGKNQDVTSWGRFTNVKNKTDEMLECLDTAFDKWLNP